jgi:uncharacterized protein (DUF302 family)
MLQVTSSLKLDGIEAALRQAAQRRGASVVSVMHLSHLIRGKEPGAPKDAIVFSLCHPDLSAALLGAELRLSAMLPCRVAAFEEGGSVILTAVSPSETGRSLNRPDLETLLLLMEATLQDIMNEVSQSAAAVAQAPSASRHRDVGATEEQVNARASIPQRIDCRGTKVEELAGTGQHDGSGG